MVLRFIVTLISFGIFFIHGTAARADEFHRQAILACSTDSNEFVIRFGFLWNDDPIESAEFTKVAPLIETRWNKFPHAAITEGKSKCTLPDGKHIHLSDGTGQAYAYGAGGANPSAYFTLMIDNKPIYYKKIYFQGYGSELFNISGILYSEGHILEDVTSLRFADQNNLPNEEKEELRHDERRQYYRDHLSDFCKKMLTEKIEPEYSEVERVPNGFLSFMDIDLNNDGKVDKVYRIGGSSVDCVSCGSHYFDGSFLFAFTNGTNKLNAFLRDIKKKEYEAPEKLYANTKQIEEWDALYISKKFLLKSPRYVYNYPVSYQGKNYIYSFSVSENAVPRRTISELIANNTLFPICAYAD